MEWSRELRRLHIEVSQLWLQDKVNRGEIMIEKVKGEANIADALTKHVGVEIRENHMKETRQELKEGRHKLAPKTSKDAKETSAEEEEWQEEDEDENNQNIKQHT